MSILLNSMLGLAEKSRLPDKVIRYGIRYLCKKRLRESVQGQNRLAAFVAQMKQAPVAPVPEKANEQHYELPARFFDLVLGPNRKYSGCIWENDVLTLREAEEKSLEQVCRRAELADGQRVLELGCGWGSLTLWMARNYPQSQITAVSNSRFQKQAIESRASALGLKNIEIITADMNDLTLDQKFDRVVSIEMFEHMRNWEILLRRIRGWMNDDARLFVHVFSNRSQPYEFETEGAGNWMGRFFFSGGIMPSHRLMFEFDQDLTVEKDWVVNGQNYAKTAEAWLSNLDQSRNQALQILEENYGPAEAQLWLQRWRIFFMACAELFAFENGRQWHISHYLLRPRVATDSP